MELYLHLVKKVLAVMVSIGQVEYRMHGNFIGIYRDGILFVKVQEEELYLLNDQGTFVKVDNKEHDIQDKLRNAYNFALVVAQYRFFNLNLKKPSRTKLCFVL